MTEFTTLHSCGPKKTGEAVRLKTIDYPYKEVDTRGFSVSSQQPTTPVKAKIHLRPEKAESKKD